MVETDVACVVDAANELGECPLWCPRERVLWWIDVAKPGVWRFRPETKEVNNWALPRPPGAIALRREGGLLVAFRRGFARFDPSSGECAPYEVPGLDLGEQRFNDGRADAAGRLWIGTMDRALSAPIGQLYRVREHEAAAVQDGGFTLSNGIGWSPDNLTMYFAETHARTIYAYDFDLSAGNVSRRRVFAVVDPGPGGPDGLCVDSKGNVWVAMFERGTVNKYRPDGALEASVRLPVARPTSCTLGGDDLKTLYITSACIGLSDEDMRGQTHAGGLWAVRVQDAGLPENCFGT